jgi:hypothetical protein
MEALRWPLIFSLQPSTLALLDAADYIYDFQRDIDAGGEQVFARFFDNALCGDVIGLRGFTWHTPEGEFPGAAIDESFVYMALRMRTVAYEPGTRLAMSIDRCSLPLGRQMLQVMDTIPRPEGGCRLRWRIAIRYLPGMSAIAPAVTPVFRRMFEQSLDAVARHFDGAARSTAPTIPDGLANSG